MSGLTIASLEGFACFQRDEDLEDRGGTSMVIPFGGAASKWHENPLQARVDELEAYLLAIRNPALPRDHSLAISMGYEAGVKEGQAEVANDRRNLAVLIIRSGLIAKEGIQRRKWMNALTLAAYALDALELEWPEVYKEAMADYERRVGLGEIRDRFSDGQSSPSG